MSELIEAALAKLREGAVPGDVAAMLERETGSPGTDGRRWRFIATNGARVINVEAELSGSQIARLGYGGSRELLEAAVERRAVTSFPIESRMEDLAASDPIRLRAEDLRQHPEPSAFT